MHQAFTDKPQRYFDEHFTASTLKVFIVSWCVLVIVLVVFFVDNPWLLAGILAYEVLP